jgi:glutamine cyclotransferase
MQAQSRLWVGAVALAAIALVIVLFLVRPLQTDSRVVPLEPAAAATQLVTAPMTAPITAAMTTSVAVVSPLPQPASVQSALVQTNGKLTATTSGAPSAALTSVAPVTETGELTTATALPIIRGNEELVAATPVYTYVVVAEYPHDPNAFTQGLQYVDGELYEGTGLNGASSLRRVALETGEVLQQVDLDDAYFGEGITVVEDQIYQLTWQSNVGFIYDRESFARQEEFSYPTEGWGITYDGEQLIMSDGSATLRRWDPETLAEVGRVDVVDQGRPITRLNELEYINGEVFANIWQTNRIARIDPATGHVTGWIDLTGLLDPEDITQRVDVLNGIAYDAENDRLFVTGKWWPKLYEIDLAPIE